MKQIFIYKVVTNSLWIYKIDGTNTYTYINKNALGRCLKTLRKVYYREQIIVIENTLAHINVGWKEF